MKIFIILLTFVILLKATEGWPLSKENRLGTFLQIQQVERILLKTPEKIGKVCKLNVNKTKIS